MVSPSLSSTSKHKPNEIKKKFQPNLLLIVEMAPSEMNVERMGEDDMVATPNDGKMAYVTFLAGNQDYWMGVVGLAKGLRKVNSVYPLVVAILPDVPEEHRQILVAQGCIVREIEPVVPPENQAGYAMAYYVINYSKLRIWEVQSYFLYSIYDICISFKI